MTKTMWFTYMQGKTHIHSLPHKFISCTLFLLPFGKCIRPCPTSRSSGVAGWKDTVWLCSREFQMNMCQVPTSTQPGRNTYRESALICKICKATKYLWTGRNYGLQNLQIYFGDFNASSCFARGCWMIIMNWNSMLCWTQTASTCP